MTDVEDGDNRPRGHATIIGAGTINHSLSQHAANRDS